MRKMNKILAMLLALVLVLQMVPAIGVAAAADDVESFVRPSVAVYPFPGRIYNANTVHFDTTTTPGVYAFDSANVAEGAAAAMLAGVGDNANITHSKDLVLIQTVCIEAMPESSNGLQFVLSDRHKDEEGKNLPGGDLLMGSIYNAAGDLKLQLADTLVIDLGAKLGEAFELAIEWNADNSGAVYVNGVCKGAYDNVNISKDYSAGDNLYYSYASVNDGAKFYLTDVAVYEGAKNAVAAAFAQLIASLDLSEVFGAANLPTTVSCDAGSAAISWTSSNPNVLDNDGKVVALPTADTKVTLTASCAGTTASVEATVKANDYIEPSSVLYQLPLMIHTGLVSNVDYTTNEGVYVIDGNVAEAYMWGKPHTAAIDHVARNLLLKQTIKIDALPEQAYTSVAEASVGGFSVFMLDRVDGNGADCQTVTATIVNEGGKLVAYFDADNKVDLGVGLGEEFELLLVWNTDNSAAVYVNGVIAGKVANATIVRSYNGNDQIGYNYSGVQGDVKITWTGVAVYDDPTAAAVEAFQALIAELDFSEVYGAANLPTSVAGATISWTSSNPAVLSNDGKVVAMPAVDTKVTLTASCAGATASVEATVKANDYIEPSSVLYQLPLMIHTGLVSNVDYTTNEGVYVIDGNVAEAYMWGKPHTAAIDHVARNLLLKQTIKIDALPEQAYTSVAEASVGGFSVFMLDRVDGNGADCQTVTATIVNEGGKLVAYFDADNKVDLGVGLGEEFELLLVWNTDNSAAVYVDGVIAGKVANATIVRSYNGNDQIGYNYSGVQGDVKITWTGVAVYDDPTAAVAEAFQALIATLDFSAVYGAANLPTEVNGNAITWTSSNPAVLQPDGKVVAIPAADTQVILTAICAGASATVTATVKANDYIAPFSALYAFPAHINTGASSNVDYTTNEGVYVIDSKLIAADQTTATLGGKANTAAIDHIARDLLLKQTIKIDAMPELTYASAAESSTGGFNLYIIDRVDGNGADCQTATLTIVNKGGKLYGYLNADTCFDLGVSLGEEFELLLRWNTDNSAAVYVDGVIVGKAQNATMVRGWNGTDQIGYRYNDLANGDVKITWTDAAVYENPMDAVASAFESVVSGINTADTITGVELPTEVVCAGVSYPITWTSSNTSIMANDGSIVARPNVNTAVILTGVCAGIEAKISVVVLAEDVKAGAVYTTDVTKEAPGYYWDAVNVYYVDADRNVTAYNMVNYGINLSDYYQNVSGVFGGVKVELTLLPVNGELLNQFGHHNVQGVPNSFNVAVNKLIFTLDKAANTADPDVSGDNTIYSQMWSGNNANIDHANDLYLEQTITIDALPEKTVAHNGVFVGGASYANGFSFFMSNRATGSGDCYTFLATIQNEGNGALTLYVANANKGSAHGSAMIDLGKKVGDTFKLGVRWDADGSAKIFVDGALVADIDDATRVLSYATGTGKYYGFTYANLDGDYKITVANAALYPAAPGNVAEDTAVSDLAAIVGALNLNNVMGNVELPVAFEYAHGAMPIVWTSSNPDVLDASGKIVSHPDVPTQVTLTASAAGQSASVVATVKPNTFIQPFDAIYSFPGKIHGASSANFDYTTNSGVYVYDSANIADASKTPILSGVGAKTVIFHSQDMILQQTICIEAMPDAPYVFNYGNGNGLMFNLSDRFQNEDGSNAPGGAMLYGSIVNVGGNLYLHLGDNDAIALGAKLGETFQLTVAWNADDSAMVYVDGKCVAVEANATVYKDYSAGDNLYYTYNNIADEVKFTLTDVAIYNPVSKDIEDALYALTTAEVLASAYTGKITGALPATYTVADIEFNVTWSVIDGIVNADGSVIKGSEDKAVTLVATVGGVKLAACDAIIAGKEKIDIDPITGIIYRNELYNQADNKDTINDAVNSGSVAIDYNKFTFSGIAALGGKTAPGVYDHSANDILIQQKLTINALTENAEMFSLDNKVYTLNGYRFLVSDRLEDGIEKTVDAAIQYVDGKLVLVVATGAKTDAEATTIALDKNLGESFVLSLLWKTDDSLMVYVDGMEIASLADGTRDSSWSGSDCTTLFANDEAADFVIDSYIIYTLGAVAQVGDDIYTNLQEAVYAAANNVYPVVTLINDAYAADLEVPAGVILNLSNKQLVVENLASFGNVVSNAESGRGSLVVKGNLELSADNAQMPVFHVDNNCYYFFDATANALGTKGTNSKITFGFAPQFSDSYAYHVMGKDAPEGTDLDCGLNVIVELNWTGNEGDAVVYELSQDLIRKYGNMAFEFAGDMTAAMMLKVTGAESLDYGSEVFVDVTVTSDTGVAMVFETIYFTIEP